MAAIFYWCEDNGAATGTPAKGTTSTYNVSNVNWKNADDTTTAYTSSPITAGSNSYTKYQYVLFSGTFNQITNVKWQHTTGALTGSFGVGLTLKGVTTSGYATPGTAANGSLTYNISDTGDIATGWALPLGYNGPHYAGAHSTITGAGYSQYIATQLQTTASAAAGNTATMTFTVRYDEN